VTPDHHVDDTATRTDSSGFIRPIEFMQMLASATAAAIDLSSSSFANRS
jgi:hypothetical protein